MKRMLAVLAVVSTALVMAPSVGTAVDGATDAAGAATPAIVTLQAESARFRGSGADRELVVTSVDPDTATFQAENGEELPISSYAAVQLLSTRPSTVAIVRPLDGDTGEEEERLELGRLKYDWTTGILAADADPAKASDVTGPLRDSAGSADDDGKLSNGPVEIVVLDTDTETSATGAPQAPPRLGASSSGYTMDLKIEYSAQLGNVTVAGTPTDYRCLDTPAFSIDLPGRADRDTQYKAATLTVDTSGDCWLTAANATYSITVGEHGPIELTIVQLAPRIFASKCTDKFPIATRCSTITGFVILHV